MAKGHQTNSASLFTFRDWLTTLREVYRSRVSMSTTGTDKQRTISDHLVNVSVDLQEPR